MTVEEVYTTLLNHMIVGVTMHNDIARVFDFLKLEGFARLHDYQQYEEKQNEMLLNHYYTAHYHKILQLNISSQTIIPNTWYQYTSQDVDINTKKKAIKDLVTKWVLWESETKKLYQKMQHELYNIDEEAAALEINKYILDVTEELSFAEAQLILLDTINYDLIEITSWQKSMNKKYKKKLGW